MGVAKIPKEQCEGPCSVDTDCREGLRCYNSSITTSLFPGCNTIDGTNINTNINGGVCILETKITNYCLFYGLNNPSDFANGGCNIDSEHHIHPTRSYHNKWLKPVLDQGGFPRPLEECAGDCDSDDDCNEGLTCYQRHGDEDVPGCTGEAKSKWDYCVKVS